MCTDVPPRRREVTFATPHSQTGEAVSFFHKKRLHARSQQHSVRWQQNFSQQQTEKAPRQTKEKKRERKLNKTKTGGLGW